MVATSIVAQESPESSVALFQLCPVTAEDDPGCRMFAFEHAVRQADSENFSSGWYSPQPILDLEGLDSIDVEIVEMGAAPYQGIVIGLNDEGYGVLGEYLKGEDVADLVVLLDGHSYEVLEVEELKRGVKLRQDIVLFIAEPYSYKDNHLVALLVEKLRANLAILNRETEAE